MLSILTSPTTEEAQHCDYCGANGCTSCAVQPAKKAIMPMPRLTAPSLLNMNRERRYLGKSGALFSRVNVDDDSRDDDNDDDDGGGGDDAAIIIDVADDSGAASTLPADTNHDGRRLWAVAIINSVYAVAQLLASVHFNSLAMRADAFHTTSDVLAAALAAHCARLCRSAGAPTQQEGSSSTPALPFGYARAEVVGALVNNAALGALCLYLTLAALPRILDPEPFTPSWAYIGVAAAGVGVNLLAAAVMLCCRAPDTPPAAMPCAHGCAHHHAAKPPPEQPPPAPSSPPHSSFPHRPPMECGIAFGIR